MSVTLSSFCVPACCIERCVLLCCSEGTAVVRTHPRVGADLRALPAAHGRQLRIWHHQVSPCPFSVQEEFIHNSGKSAASLLQVHSCCEDRNSLRRKKSVNKQQNLNTASVNPTQPVGNPQGQHPRNQCHKHSTALPCLC